LGVLHAAVAKRDVDAVRDEVRRRIAQEKFDRHVRIRGTKLAQQRGDDLAAETDGRADAQVTAGPPLAEIAHLVDGLDDPVDAGVAPGAAEVAPMGQRGAPGGARAAPRLQRVLESLAAAA